MKFSKMHGISNDFMIIDAINQKVNINSDLVKKLSNRNTGVGFDQLLIIESSKNLNIDFHYRIFNADGKEVSQCGNGARCFAYFLHIKGLTKKNKLIVSTISRKIVINKISEKIFRVNMGIPKFSPNEIPFEIKKEQEFYEIIIFRKKIKFFVVSLGNPHCIIYVKKINKILMTKVAPYLSVHKSFPEGINVSFVEKINNKNINMRVYERGVGETNACGTAACAAVVIGIKKKILSNKVSVNLLGGKLEIFWKGKNFPIYMTGSATYVYDGTIKI